MSTASRRPDIQVTIDEVVLRGVPPERAREVLADIEAALGDRAREAALDGVRGFGSGRVESSRRLPEVSCGSTAAVGGAIADAVWQELTRPGRPPRSGDTATAAGTAIGIPTEVRP